MIQDIIKKHPELILRPNASLRRVMEVLTKCHYGVALVADAQRRFLGLITDADIRRAILSGAGMNTPVSRVMNRKPITASADLPSEKLADLFRTTAKAYIPVVDGSGRLKSLASLSQFATIPARHPNWVVVMAGGQGKRLRPLTNNTPKPMLKLGGKPILEHLLAQFAEAGFSRFIFTVNYLADQIRAHFGDGSRWGAEIEYVHESRPLGTVGALALIKRCFTEPILVANGDILTKVDFKALLHFHETEKGLATLCVRRHEIQVPYGVVELDGRRLNAFVEKPVQRLLVNAGIYVLEPKALSWLSKNKPCDMPDLLKDIRRRKPRGVACFPIEEYWLDIGGMKEWERAAGEYARHFGRP